MPVAWSNRTTYRPPAGIWTRAETEAYCREHGKNFTDDSLLIAHIRSNMKRGTQRKKLEASVERGRQLKMQIKYYDEQVSSAKKALELEEGRTKPMLELDVDASTKLAIAKDIRRQVADIEASVAALKQKIARLESKANGT